MVPSVTLRVIVALASVLIFLAGCVENGAQSSAARPSLTVSADSEFGLVTGQITDAEARPIDGADVGIRGANLVSRTDASGKFQIGDVKPGKHVLDVARLGFAPVAREIEIQAGRETRLDVQLEPLAIPDAAYYRVWPYSGFLDCALGSAVWVSTCSYPYTAAFLAARDGYCLDSTCTPKLVNGSQYGLPSDLQANRWRYNFTVQPGAADVVSEMTWTPTSAAATKLMLILSCPQYDPVLDDCSPQYASVSGTSPLRTEWKPTQVKPPAWVMSRAYLPFSGAQLAFQQKFDTWNTVWYNAPAPDGWTVLAEGKR